MIEFCVTIEYYGNNRGRISIMGVSMIRMGTKMTMDKGVK